MKYYFICLFLLIAFSACEQKNKEAERTSLETSYPKSRTDKEAEIDSLESEMINFFQATLEKNYGRKDAVDLLVKGLRRYHFNYLLDVDKAEEILKKESD